ncbi:MAG: PQQ-like beta-propeller repeat protein [Planctomycetes bacterium]|nr:PQQ-like beta-propeller repeat protein [Planctomycetota bacterium]
MDDSSQHAPDAQPSTLRLWPLLVILLLAVAGLITAASLGTLAEDTESGVPWTVAYVTGALTFLALAGWLLLLSRMAAVPKWTIFGIGCLSVVLLFATLKLEFTGNLTPTVRPRSWLQALWQSRNISVEKQDAVDLVTSGPNDVPEFLGPGRRPVFPNIALDTDWKAHPPREVWRRPIGLGFGSFAVVGDYGVTQQQEGSDELVVCYEWRTGRPRWKHADRASFASSLGGDGPRATPTIDGGRVYSMGATGILNCLDGSNGKVIWQTDTLKDNQARNQDWGISCSPLVVDNLVVVSAGLSDPALKQRSQPHYALIAYDKNTGKPVWRGGTDDASYCSPTLITLGGVRQIAIVNAGSVTGHDPKDGRVLWEFPWQRNMPTVSQVVALDDDRVFISKGYGAGCGVFRVTQDEPGKWAVEQVWTKATMMRTKFTNAVIVGKQAYGLDDGFLQCIDLEKPRLRWTTRSHRQADYRHGQVLLVGDLLLVQSEQGDVALVAAKPDKFQELARFSPLSGRTWNYPVMVGNFLLTRNDREAVCYELPVKVQP